MSKFRHEKLSKNTYKLMGLSKEYIKPEEKSETILCVTLRLMELSYSGNNRPII